MSFVRPPVSVLACMCDLNIYATKDWLIASSFIISCSKDKSDFFSYNSCIFIWVDVNNLDSHYLGIRHLKSIVKCSSITNFKWSDGAKTSAICRTIFYRVTVVWAKIELHSTTWSSSYWMIKWWKNYLDIEKNGNKILQVAQAEHVSHGR